MVPWQTQGWEGARGKNKVCLRRENWACAKVRRQVMEALMSGGGAP